MAGFLDAQLSAKTPLFGLKLWVLIGICVGAFIVLILFFLSLWLSSRSKKTVSSSKLTSEKTLSSSIPMVSKEINVDHIGEREGPLPTYNGYDDLGSSPRSDTEKGKKTLWKMVEEEDGIDIRSSRSAEEKGMVVMNMEKKSLLNSNMSGESHTSANPNPNPNHNPNPNPNPNSNPNSNPNHNFNLSPRPSPSPSYTSVSEVTHLGWGHWYSLGDLEAATDFFSDSNVLGEGGYGIVYRGQMPDASFIAVKHLLNNRGQAEREFSVEVEAIGKVRHKNLVRLIGYCAEGSHRMLVYEYVDNGNLDQWLHGKLGENNAIPWEGRMRIALGTAKGLAYLHEGLEPKVVHRDVKSSNILLDTEWNPKVSDFGLAKLLGAGKSFVTTRVMGTFGYVAPEYASTGLLNERSDVYSFGVLLMEIITGRDPVDYSRPNGEVNLVDWLKMMVGSRRSEEVVDPRLHAKPSARALKRALLVALRCVDPDAQKRPKMGHVVHLLEADDYPYRDERRSRTTPVFNNHKDELLSPTKRLVINNQRDNLNKGIFMEDKLELLIESPSGPGYKPSLRRYGS